MEISIFQGFRHLFCQKMQHHRALSLHGKVFVGSTCAIDLLVIWFMCRVARGTSSALNPVRGRDGRHMNQKQHVRRNSKKS